MSKIRSIHKTANRNPLQAVSNGATMLIHLRFALGTTVSAVNHVLHTDDESSYCFPAHQIGTGLRQGNRCAVRPRKQGIIVALMPLSSNGCGSNGSQFVQSSQPVTCDWLLP